MKKVLLAFLGALILVNGAFAEEQKKLYKWVDKDGSVHFSDEPAPGAEEIKVKEVPTIKLKNPTLQGIDLDAEFENTQQSPTDGIYEILTLEEPLDDGVIRNNASQITLRAKIVPELFPQHSLHFFIDGKPVAQDANATSATLENAEYGEHTASVVIIDSRGKLIQSSKTHHFNLLHVINKKNRK